MKQALIHALKRPVTWAAIALLLASIGIQMPPAMIEALKVLGPIAAETVDEVGE